MELGIRDDSEDAEAEGTPHASSGELDDYGSPNGKRLEKYLRLDLSVEAVIRRYRNILRDEVPDPIDGYFDFKRNKTRIAKPNL